MSLRSNAIPLAGRSRQERGFCSQCGSPLFLRYDEDNRIRLTGGSLDHRETVSPQYHDGAESRLPWVDCGRGLPEQETEESF